MEKYRSLTRMPKFNVLISLRWVWWLDFCAQEQQVRLILPKTSLSWSGCCRHTSCKADESPFRSTPTSKANGEICRQAVGSELEHPGAATDGIKASMVQIKGLRVPLWFPCQPRYIPNVVALEMFPFLLMLFIHDDEIHWKSLRITTINPWCTKVTRYDFYIQ